MHATQNAMGAGGSTTAGSNTKSRGIEACTVSEDSLKHRRMPRHGRTHRHTIHTHYVRLRGTKVTDAQKNNVEFAPSNDLPTVDSAWSRTTVANSAAASQRGVYARRYTSKGDAADSIRCSVPSASDPSQHSRLREYQQVARECQGSQQSHSCSCSQTRGHTKPREERRNGHDDGTR